ncbi:unnamed protein product [Cylicocyclus nassatus]|uniref:Uncharacterized protein n=1 Tax=Cylicocyclus nassatus TaxID=53992 RepID=A0AA36DS06_CYLNA|nr:unnamed protein product [Cylicocyclus nassatus]
MFKLLVLLSIALVIYTKKEHEFKDIPGVSTENMEKLRKLMDPRPESREDFKKKMHEWMNSLPEDEKKAAEKHREERRKAWKLKHQKNETETIETESSEDN